MNLFSPASTDTIAGSPNKFDLNIFPNLQQFNPVTKMAAIKLKKIELLAVPLPWYVIFHEFSNCCSRIRFQVANCFTQKRPPHPAWWKIKIVVMFSFAEINGKNCSKDHRKYKESEFQVRHSWLQIFALSSPSENLNRFKISFFLSYRKRLNQIDSGTRKPENFYMLQKGNFQFSEDVY